MEQQPGELTLVASIWNAPSTAYAQIINNGQVVADAPVGQEPTDLHYTTQADPTQPNWYRLDVYGEDGLALVVTNPIFAGPVKKPPLVTYGDFITVGQKNNETL